VRKALLSLAGGLGTAAVVISCIAGEREIGNRAKDGRVSQTAIELVNRIEKAFPDLVSRNSNGMPESLELPSEHIDAQSLALVSEFDTIHTLKLNGLPGTNAAGLSSKGIACLAEMHNLRSLALRCFPARGLNRGVFESISRLTQVRKLTLYSAAPPREEYVCITNMAQLSSVRILWCTNFGDDELRWVTNLAHLGELVLMGTSVSPSGTNILRHAGSVTNVVVKMRASK
jgi:hypothetical protein